MSISTGGSKATPHLQTAKGLVGHTAAVEDVLNSLGTSPTTGRRTEQIASLQQQFGFNELTVAPPPALWRKFVGQFNESVIWILIVAALVSGLMGEWPDAVAILAIVLLNGVMGFFQEERAERSLVALQKLSAPVARVLRDGARRLLPARELVPGDLLELEAGDSIPADARLVQAFGLQVQEAALTGESTPVSKNPASILPAATPLGDRHNMLYLGTLVVAGRARAIVVATGMQTELGHIAGMIERYEPEPTPLQRRLGELGKVLIFICLIAVGVIFALQMIRGGDRLQIFLISVSLAVAAVPEGLPAVVTMALALGLQRMVKRHALIRKLPSVETLGSVTVICSDKTGTLTRNEMTVREIWAGNQWYMVTGSGYTPRGQFHQASPLGITPAPSDWSEIDRFGVIHPRQAPDLLQALTIAACCTNARLMPPRGETETWQVMGDPTEAAMLVAALKAGLEQGIHEYRTVHEIPFDSDRKAMSVVMCNPSGALVMYTKGAPEIILEKCTSEQRGGRIETLTDARRREILEAGAGMASRALRVLALAYRDCLPDEPANFSEHDLSFAGLVGMIDPPREEARSAVRECHEAGIRPVMITGDHPATALAIARELRIATDTDGAITGSEMDAMSDEDLAAQVERISVYARVSAEHKLRVVRAWRGRQEIVAMTGDGVNDAPAVKAADIGIAMGNSGSEVTREASAMVLTDDNFASIVNAVEEGRCIYDNIQKVLYYLLSCNSGEILLMLVASLLGWPAPLVPIQLLWINLVTDGLPALALCVERPEPGLMKRKPRPPREPILTAHAGLRLLLQGGLVGGVGLLGFGIAYWSSGESEAAVGRARTMAFSVIVYAELFRAMAARSQTLTAFELGWCSNPLLLSTITVSSVLQFAVIALPWTRPVFGTVQHHAWEWIAVALLALTPATVIEVSKLWKRYSTRLA